MASRNRIFTKLAKDIDPSGNIKTEGIASDVELGGGITVFNTRDQLPTSGNEQGDQAYVTGNNRLYIWNGSGWYNVALLNVAPSIQSVLDSDGGTTPFSLSIDGTATTITITAADSDGDPITYEAAADSDFAGLGTISQADNVFTITPFSSDSATTETGTITFTATDGVNVASSGVQTFRLFFVSALWDETVLSIGTNSANGLDNSTFVDRSSNAYTVTPTGSPVQTAFHPYLDNWSSEFSGSEWIQTVSTNSAFDFSAGGDFTIEMWVKDNLTTDGVRTIMNMKSGSYGFLFRRHSSNRWELYYNGSNRTYLYIADYGSLTDWYHMAITLQSGQLRWFVNGQEGFTTSSITQSNYNFTTLDLGSYSNGNWNGYISNVRVVKGTALYTSNFTPPTEKLTAVSGTTFLAHQSNRFIDNGGNNEPITISAGTLKVSAYNPFGQGYEYAVGENKGSAYIPQGSYINVNHGASQALLDNNFTIEWWMNLQAAVPNDNVLLDKGWGGSAYGELLIYNKGANYLAYMSSTGSTWNILSQFDTGWGQKLNEWQHFAIVRNGSQVAFLLNGKLTAGSTNIGSLSVFDTGDPITICNANGGTKNHPTTYISDFKWLVGTAVYDATGASVGDQVFTPPTSPVGNTNADLYLPMDNAGISDKTGNHILTLGGDVATSTTQTKFADTSMYFDGSGDYITSDLIDLSDGDFTVETWVYPTASGSASSTAIVFIGNSNVTIGNDIQLGIYITSTNTFTLRPYSGATDYSMTSSAQSLNTWHHLAITRDGSSFKAFVNGTQVGTTKTISGSLNAATNSQIGLWTLTGTAIYYTGYIENLQILKGVAKYTANFTPPVQTQGRVYQAES